MTQEFTGPFADELTATVTELNHWQQEQTTLDGKIAQAIANRDLDQLAPLIAKRNALPLIVTSIEAERAQLQERRGATYGQQLRDQYDAAMAARPERETVIDPATGNRHTVIRAKM